VATAAAQKTFQEALVTSLGPRTKTTSETQTAQKENPSQSLAKLLKTCQELTGNNSAQRHMNRQFI
jgi:hypothetical protein